MPPAIPYVRIVPEVNKSGELRFVKRGGEYHAVVILASDDKAVYVQTEFATRFLFQAEELAAANGKSSYYVPMLCGRVTVVLPRECWSEVRCVSSPPAGSQTDEFREANLLVEAGEPDTSVDSTGEYTPHEQDPTLLEAFHYINQVPGKDIRGKLIDAFQRWFRIPDDKVVSIKELIGELHNASLLIDDIEDDSTLRRGIPVAHSIYGTPTTINCANYVYFLALERCHRLGNAKAMNVFVLELLNLHRGQGQDIFWRDNLRCPTEEEYERMVLDKTGGLFRLAVGLMQAFSSDDK